MPKPTFHNLPADKQARILDAAVDEFAAMPYAKANLDRVVAAAEISKGSLYQYFDGKADLYRHLLTVHLPAAKLGAIAGAMPDPSAPVWDQFEAAFKAGARFAVAFPRLTRLGIRFHRDHEIEPELADIAAQHRAAGHAWVRGLLEQAHQAGALRPSLDLDVAASFLAYALGEGGLDVLAGRLGCSVDALLDTPERLASLTDADLSAVVVATTDLFRHGAEAR